MCVPAMSCPEDSMPEFSALYSGSYFIFVSSDPSMEEVAVDDPTMGEHLQLLHRRDFMPDTVKEVKTPCLGRPHGLGGKYNPVLSLKGNFVKLTSKYL